MNKYKRLLENSIIFAIGNFGSKIIGIIMVPLYTYALSVNDYGTVDLLITTVSLLIPIVIASIDQSVLRFVMRKNYDSVDVLNNAIFLGIVSSSIILIIMPIVLNLFPTNYSTTYFILLLILQSFQTIFSQFVRGIGRVKLYAINGIVMTFAIALFNLLFLMKINYGVNGYLLSLVLSNLLSILIFLSVRDVRNSISFNFNRNLLLEMLSYSIPLIPNSIMWWLINSSTRYFILFFLGASANGIFAVANKLPTLITMITSIFSQAWQLSAIEEFGNKDSKKFYSDVFHLYSSVLFLGASFLLLFVKQIVLLTVQSSYYQAWTLVPALIFAVLYQSFSAFIGTNYTASLKTKGVFVSTLIGAGLSIVLNSILIPLFGVQGAGVGSALSFFITWLYRMNDTKKFAPTYIIKSKFLLLNLFLLIQSVGLFITNQYLFYIFGLTMFFLQITLNLNFIKIILTKFKKRGKINS